MKKLQSFLFTLCCLVSTLASAGALTEFRVGAIYPQGYGREVTAQNIQLSSQNTATAGCFSMEDTDTITSVGFINSSVTGTAASITNDSYTLSIQLPDASGNPSGTPVGGASPASVTFPTSGVAGGVTLGTSTSHVLTLANPASLTRGTVYCIVIQRTGATDVTNNITVRYAWQGTGSSNIMPYAATADATPTWTKNTLLMMGTFMRSSTRSYLYPYVAGYQVAPSGTAEKGFTFTLPATFGASSSYTVCGIIVPSTSTATSGGGTVVATLYGTPLSSSPPILQQTSLLDSDALGATNGSSGRTYRFNFATPVALTPGVTYGVGLASSIASFGTYGFTIPAAGDSTAYALLGLKPISRTLTDYPPSANDTSSFTELTTAVDVAELVICDFTAPAGSTGFMRLR